MGEKYFRPDELRLLAWKLFQLGHDLATVQDITRLPLSELEGIVNSKLSKPQLPTKQMQLQIDDLFCRFQLLTAGTFVDLAQQSLLVDEDLDHNKASFRARKPCRFIAGRSELICTLLLAPRCALAHNFWCNSGDADHDTHPKKSVEIDFNRT